MDFYVIKYNNKHNFVGILNIITHFFGEKKAIFLRLAPWCLVLKCPPIQCEALFDYVST